MLRLAVLAGRGLYDLAQGVHHADRSALGRFQGGPGDSVGGGVVFGCHVEISLAIRKVVKVVVGGVVLVGPQVLARRAVDDVDLRTDSVAPSDEIGVQAVFDVGDRIAFPAGRPGGEIAQGGDVAVPGEPRSTCSVRMMFVQKVRRVVHWNGPYASS